MSDFQRYAVYYLPEEGPLAAFGASWLGWDVGTGVPVSQPETPFDLAEVTATPRKYGFHGTLKPPFRLAEGTDMAGLQTAVAELATRTPAVRLDGLKLASLGKFLALIPEGDSTDLAELAFACVSELDRFRAPPSEAELARRRASGLSERQEELLLQWGYPYVADQFRFHLTLSGRLDSDALDIVQDAAGALMGTPPQPFEIKSISLAGERGDGMFQLIHRYALTG